PRPRRQLRGDRRGRGRGDPEDLRLPRHGALGLGRGEHPGLVGDGLQAGAHAQHRDPGDLRNRAGRDRRGLRRLHRALRRIHLSEQEDEMEQSVKESPIATADAEWRDLTEPLSELGVDLSEMFPEVLDDPRLRAEYFLYAYSQIATGF